MPLTVAPGAGRIRGRWIRERRGLPLPRALDTSASSEPTTPPDRTTRGPAGPGACGTPARRRGRVCGHTRGRLGAGRRAPALSMHGEIKREHFPERLKPLSRTMTAAHFNNNRGHVGVSSLEYLWLFSVLSALSPHNVSCHLLMTIN